ncbi:hypothetical protein L1049_000627 [Liquidambar formosana]|uniref:Reverse transcriptase n=1 Tax=Liquidambar formosana TaxID=63359 RepID=A0AAP0N947_LIQFO
MPHSRRSLLSTMSGMVVKDSSSSFSYLGCPIFKGRVKCSYFVNIVQMFRSRLEGWYAKLLSNMGRVILTKHVLNAIPTHVLACTTIPKTVLNKLNSIMAKFLWCDKDFDKRRHWVSWDLISLPFEEGGLGVRDFNDISAAFRVKQVWQWLQKDSLWADFVDSKYVTGTLNSSQLWKSLLPWVSFTIHHSKYLVGNGEKVDFWRSNWLGNGPLIERASTTPLDFPSINQVLHNGRWDFTSIGSILSEDTLSDIVDSGVLISGGEDKLIWQPNSDGFFSLKSAWNLVRHKSSFNGASNFI